LDTRYSTHILAPLCDLDRLIRYPTRPWRMLFPVVQHFGQDLSSAVGLGFTDRGSKYGNEIFHLRSPVNKSSGPLKDFCEPVRYITCESVPFSGGCVPFRLNSILSFPLYVKFYFRDFNPMSLNQALICPTVSLPPLLYSPKPSVTVESGHIYAIFSSNKPTPPPPWV
jgi:hypothetical protein